MKHERFPVADYQHGTGDIMAVGNFGVMYRAFWKRRGIFVALKHVPRNSEAGRKVDAEERGAMLQQQFGSAHAGIVPEIYEHGKSDNGDYYIAMELLDGRALSTCLREERITHDQAVRIAAWIAGDFLASLHAFRVAADDPADMIVYSDLKPDHIFMLRDGSFRALDFGITKRVQQANTSTVNPWASVPYASPRRLREGVVDRDADFWALGVILYEMVAGHHLYPGLSAEAMSRAIERQDPPAPLPPCDPNLAAVIRKLLAPQRHESYQSAEEIAEDLRTLMAGGVPLAASARISTSVPTARVPVARERMPVASVGSVPTDPLPAQGHATLHAQPAAEAAVPVTVQKRKKRWGFKRVALAVGAGIIIINVLSGASERARLEDFQGRISSIEVSELSDVRETLRGFDELPADVRNPLVARLVTLAERPILDFRTELPTVTKREWEDAREALKLARELRPRDEQIQAREKYVEAHLTRISAEGLSAQAERTRLEQAVSQFREAARLDESMPDPYLGLARIHAYDFRDFDALMDDLEGARARGYRATRRERAQTGDAYRFRADRTRARARTIVEGEERIRLLREAADDYDICAERFEALGTFLDSERNFRLCQQQSERVRIEIDRLLFSGLFGRGGI